MINSNTEFAFHFFRHGESRDNTNLEFIGGKDPEITPLGVRQARALGLRLKKEKIKFDGLYCSSLQRVTHTARVVCGVADYNFDKVVVVSALEELDTGLLAGSRRDEIYTGASGRLITYLGPWFRPPGGESQKMVQRRVSEWFEKEFLQNEGFFKSERKLNFAIFGSGMNFKCLFQDITGWDSSMLWKFTLDNCSISRFRFNERGWFVDCVNDTGHLLGLI